MQSYLETTRSPWYSLVFVLPLWLLYEALELVLEGGHGLIVRNGADAILMRGVGLLGVRGPMMAEACLALVAAMCVYHTDKTHRGATVKPSWLLGMLLESVVYALLLGGVVARLVQIFVPTAVLGLDAGTSTLGLGAQFMTSLGAGVFEELLFRVILMGGLTWAGVHWLRLHPGVSVSIAAILSSLLFAAFHYVGVLGDAFSMASFVYRFFAGLVLACLYRTRGFGVAAGTHALYDVFLLLQGIV